MAIRVPLLLETVEAVVHRLDLVETRAVDPPTLDTQGYDDTFRELIVSDPTTGASVDTRTSTRQEMTAIRVPCQVEVPTFEDLGQSFAGDDPSSYLNLVLHRADLLLLSLIDGTTGDCLLKKGDRVSRIERRGLGTSILNIKEPGLFITAVEPASWGFGPDGYDLHIVTLKRRKTSA